MARSRRLLDQDDTRRRILRGERWRYRTGNTSTSGVTSRRSFFLNNLMPPVRRRSNAGSAMVVRARSVPPRSRRGTVSIGSSIGEAAARAASVAARAALTAVLPSVSGSTMSLASTVPNEAMRRVFNYVGSQTRNANKFRYGSKKWFGSSTGYYRGKFRKPKKIKNTVEAQACKQGYHSTEETYGRVEDPHTLYIQHSTWNLDLYARTIQGAILRKLIRKAGYTVQDSNQELPFYDHINSSGVVFEYVVKTPTDGTFQVYPLTTGNNQTFENVIDNFSDMRTHLRNYLLNTDFREPSEIHMYVSEVNGAFKQLAASLNLKSEIITLWAGSSLVVQNRSSGAQAGESDKFELDRIDNVPVKGIIYQFKHADPRLKHVSDIAIVQEDRLNRNPELGLGLIQGTTDLLSQYQELPQPKRWVNCYRTSNIILQPGTMKKTYIQTKFKGRLVNVMKMLRCELFTPSNPPVPGDGFVSGVMGKCQIVGIEEKIRTAAVNPITITYQREIKVGVVLKTMKPTPILSKLTTREVDNT